MIQRAARFRKELHYKGRNADSRVFRNEINLIFRSRSLDVSSAVTPCSPVYFRPRCLAALTSWKKLKIKILKGFTWNFGSPPALSNCNCNYNTPPELSEPWLDCASHNKSYSNCGRQKLKSNHMVINSLCTLQRLHQPQTRFAVTFWDD